MKGLLFIICAVILAYGFIDHRRDRPIVRPPGVLVSEQPLQAVMQATSFFVDDYELTRRARFEIRARVLSREPYYLRRESELEELRKAGVISYARLDNRIIKKAD